MERGLCFVQGLQLLGEQASDYVVHEAVKKLVRGLMLDGPALVSVCPPAAARNSSAEEATHESSSATGVKCGGRVIRGSFQRFKTCTIANGIHCVEMDKLKRQMNKEKVENM